MMSCALDPSRQLLGSSSDQPQPSCPNCLDRGTHTTAAGGCQKAWWDWLTGTKPSGFRAGSGEPSCWVDVHERVASLRCTSPHQQGVQARVPPHEPSCVAKCVTHHDDESQNINRSGLLETEGRDFPHCIFKSQAQNRTIDPPCR